MSTTTIGEKLKKLRTEKGLSQLEFSSILNISNTTLSMYESNKRIPSDDIKKKLADFFNVSLDYLMGISELKNTTDSISKAVETDFELTNFWNKMKERESLQLLFKQTKDMNDRDINQVLRIIKAIKNEEDKHDNI